MKSMPLKLLSYRLFQVEMRTRMPFRYGIASLTQLPHLLVRAEVQVGDSRAHGWAADGLALKWFT